VESSPVIRKMLLTSHKTAGYYFKKEGQEGEFRGEYATLTADIGRRKIIQAHLEEDYPYPGEFDSYVLNREKGVTYLDSANVLSDRIKTEMDRVSLYRNHIDSTVKAHTGVLLTACRVLKKHKKYRPANYPEVCKGN